ncbi:sensor histidine kinase [Christensenellaceae bacterium OttesenSCG-928-L17]|nr:sensor histidine kinase [Christensenellaceae bacterium OttesenSCG-928-L17]
MRNETKPAHKPVDAGARRRPVFYTFIYLFTALAVFLVMALVADSDAVYVESREELTGFDYNARIAYISPACFAWYPKALYTPNDFATGAVVEPYVDDGKSGYYTYRLLLDLMEGQVYGISGYSATHAQTLWVDGALLSSVGTPGDSLETMVPKSNFYAVYFTAGPGPTEIVIQRSSFVHANTGQLTPVYVGAQPLITRLNHRAVLQTSVMLGCTLMASLFFFGIFLFFKTRKHFLWFSLSCLLIAVRTTTVDYKLIMMLLPDLNWHAALRIEYVSTFLFSFFVILCVDSVFEGRLNRRVKLGGLLSCAVCTLIILVTPSTFYTSIKPLFQASVILFTSLVALQLIRLAVRERGEQRFEHLLILFGGAAYIASSLVDVVLHSTGGRYDNVNFLKVGALVFVFANTLALALNFQRVELALSAAQKSQRELDEANRLLTRLNNMKTDFLANISHEMKTPLTIMGGYAQLADWHLGAGTADADTRENLRTIAQEAERLGQMVDRLLHMSAMKGGALERAPIPAMEILQRAAAVSEPILQKNGNRITLHVEEGCPAVLANGDYILQVLLNLLSNAGRHTKDDTVRLSAHRQGDMVAFSVEDHGDGIAPELLSEIFRRDISGDGGTGLGLSICKGAVEDHGGSITIESELGKGTTIHFTLPAAQEGTR